MMDRLRAFLREIGGRLWALLDEIGPERVLAATIVTLIILLLTLPLAAIYVGVLSLRQEAAEQRPARGEEAPPAVRPEDIPLIFGPGPSGGPSEATFPDGRRVGIKGLSDMDVIGALPHVPGTAFRCPGGGPVGDGRLSTRTCRSSRADGTAVYEVTLVEDDPLRVVSVTATARDAPEEEAAEVLGRVAELSLKDAAPMEAASWVKRNISSGGQYFADGAEVRLYGTERSRTLEIVASAPPAAQVPEITDRSPPETTQPTTSPRRPR